MYRYELHLHTAACSRCARSSAYEMMDALHQNGYTGAVMTNHFYRGNTCIDRTLSWEAFVAAYEQDYLAAKTYAARYDMDVLFGVEEGYGGGLEVLIYGLSPQQLANCPAMMNYDLAQLSQFVRANDGFLVCAHPFRKREYVTQNFDTGCAALLDGVETYNHSNEPQENKEGKAFAQANRLTMLSGGDAHVTDKIGYAGIATEQRLTDNRTLVEVLKSGAFRRIENGEIV